MKLLVTILVTLFCVAASFETKYSPRLSLREFVLSIPLQDFDESIVKYERNIKCVQGVMDATFTDTDLKSAWEETKSMAEQFVTVDVKKCLNVVDAEKHKKCKEALLKNGADVFFDFVLKFNTPEEQELARKMLKALKKKCLEIKFLISIFNQFRKYNILHSLPDIVGDYTVILGDVSKANGLENKWSEVEPQLNLHIQNWSKCSKKGAVLAALCHVKEGMATTKMVSHYTNEVSEEYPQLSQVIVSEIRKRWFD